MKTKIAPLLLTAVLVFESCFSVNGQDAEAFAAGTSNQGLNVDAASASVTEGQKSRRYFIYDVYIGEGFNLRRDVYSRAAQLVKELRKVDPNWVMVLPPFRHLYHWQSGFEQQRVPWSQFFDLDALGEYIPVMEFEDYMKERGDNSIDQVQRNTMLLKKVNHPLRHNLTTVDHPLRHNLTTVDHSFSSLNGMQETERASKNALAKENFTNFCIQYQKVRTESPKKDAIRFYMYSMYTKIWVCHDTMYYSKATEYALRITPQRS